LVQHIKNRARGPVLHRGSRYTLRVPPMDLDPDVRAGEQRVRGAELVALDRKTLGH